MHNEPRVPMKPKPASMIAEDDVAASVTTLSGRVGRRFSLDIDEEVLAKMGAMATEHIAGELGKQVAYRHQHLIEAAVSSYLTDRAWAEPIIRAAIRESVNRIVFDMLSSAEQLKRI